MRNIHTLLDLQHHSPSSWLAPDPKKDEKLKSRGTTMTEERTVGIKIAGGKGTTNTIDSKVSIGNEAIFSEAKTIVIGFGHVISNVNNTDSEEPSMIIKDNIKSEITIGGKANFSKASGIVIGAYNRVNIRTNQDNVSFSGSALNNGDRTPQITDNSVSNANRRTNPNSTTTIGNGANLSDPHAIALESGNEVYRNSNNMTNNNTNVQNNGHRNFKVVNCESNNSTHMGHAEDKNPNNRGIVGNGSKQVGSSRESQVVFNASNGTNSGMDRSMHDYGHAGPR